MADDWTMPAAPTTHTLCALVLNTALGTLALAAWPALGQSPTGTDPTPLPAGQLRGLTPVDAGRPDVSPFALSFRRLQIDLRRPLGFDQVYQIDPAPPLIGAMGRPTGPPRYARQSGALTAVFPRSEYRPTEDGVKVVVPADARFHIGRVDDVVTPAGSAPAPAQPRTSPAWHGANTAANTMADNRADRGAPRNEIRTAAATSQTAAASTSSPTASPSEGMMSSEAYRIRRLRELLGEAVKAAESAPERDP